MLFVQLVNGVKKMSKEIKGRLITNEELYKDKTVLVFVIDDEVVQTFVCDDRMAAIFQSNPTVVDITGRDMVLDGPQIGWTYDGENFKPPFYEYN
jgi:hypothetical protein